MVKRLRDKAGFTLIEVIIVVLLIGLAAALVLPRGLREATTGAALDTEAQKLAGVIRLARQKAMAKNMKFTVNINEPDYTIVSGDGAIEEEPVTRDERIEVKNVPAMKIEFLAGGAPVQPVTVVLETTGEKPQSKTIEVNRLGIIDIR